MHFDNIGNHSANSSIKPQHFNVGRLCRSAGLSRGNFFFNFIIPSGDVVFKRNQGVFRVGFPGCVNVVVFSVPVVHVDQ